MLTVADTRWTLRIASSTAALVGDVAAQSRGRKSARCQPGRCAAGPQPHGPLGCGDRQPPRRPL